MERLVSRQELPSCGRLVLGTAQWGMAYGIANRGGKAPANQVRAILRLARKASVCTLDTARAYGQSEEVIGSLAAGESHWRVVTKITPDLPDDQQAIVDATKKSLRQSRQALQRDELDTVLLHRADHLTRGGAAAWRHLLREQREGLIKRVGVSVRTPEEALDLVDHPQIEALQVPFSLLDQRLRRANFFGRAKAERKEVFVRSVFLQGVAFMPSGQLTSYLKPLAVLLGALDRWAQDNGFSRAEVFLRYAQAQPARLVLGCESAEQLSQNLEIWRRGALPPHQVEEVEALVPELPAALLDPAQWPSSERAPGPSYRAD